jgi:GTP-binding protein Era
MALSNPHADHTLPLMTRAGIVTVVGRPNAGKSTLLNRIVGQKLSITSPKPQSTRDRIVGIHTEHGVQMVLFDTPGLLEPRYALQRSMREAALVALADADVIVHVVDGTEHTIPTLREAASLDTDPRAPVITAVNKSDVLRPADLERIRELVPDAHFISALLGDGVAELLAAVSARLPESPFLYPEDEISTQQLRFFVTELVRETALEQLEDEVPYSVACEVEEFRESATPVYIRAVIFVERDSQKAILIGKGGSRIREIGRAARVKIEELVDGPVFLDLRVKVLQNWRRNALSMKRFGYHLTEEPQR